MFDANNPNLSVARPLATVGGEPITLYCDACYQAGDTVLDEVVILSQKPQNECPPCAY